uniref:2-aminoethanethiol dioxygenase n=1 Tax=Pogona vitticeps TaxID=103695 RepID=A0ABM5G0U1_9SAUR
MQRIPGRGEGRKRGGQAARRRLRRSPHPLRLGGGGGGGTMPRDNMASLIQRVARQARVTFRPPGANNNSSAGGGGSGAGGNGGPRFVENLQRLQQLLNEVRAEDLRLVPRGPSAVPGPVQPPVSYMHICETESFSMGVFVLRAGACIPLHDHPGMNGLLKVLYGTLRIACFDPLGAPADGPGPGNNGGGGGRRSACESSTAAAAASPSRPASSSSRRRQRALLRSHQLYTPASSPCLLSPHADNLHQIDAVGGPAAFLDILAPPYDPEHGRDCHYYRLLDGQSLPPPGPADQLGLPKEVWLLETPQAADFWCGGEPYPGPQVSP